MVDGVDSGVGAKGQEWIGRLFRAIATYESGSEAFDTEAFMDLYSRAERAIELSGESESQAFGLDQALFNAISMAEIDTSDLRMAASHMLSIHHRYHADYGRGFEQAYRWCERSRKEQMPDLRFLHTYVLPALLRKGALGGNLELALFLVERMGRFENLEKVPVMEDEASDAFLKLEPGERVYQLARRRVMYIAENLTRVPNSLEQRLHKDGAFRRLRAEFRDTLPLLAFQIELYEYDRKDPWYRRVLAAVSGMMRGLVERMAGEYIAYELTKRRGAYIVQGVLVVLIVLGLTMALFGWAYRSQQRLSELEDDLKLAGQILDRAVIQLDAQTDSLRVLAGR